MKTISLVVVPGDDSIYRQLKEFAETNNLMFRSHCIGLIAIDIENELQETFLKLIAGDRILW